MEERTLEEIFALPIKEFGLLTGEQIAEKSRCPQRTANLGIIGDNQTLDRFLAKRPKSGVRQPISFDTKYDVAGDFVDVGTYMSGEPECMVSYEGQQEVKSLKIDVLLGRPHWTKDWQVFRYYSNVLHIIDDLESKGIRCQVVARFYGYNEKRKECAHMTILLKDYSDPFNLALFAGIILNNDYYTNAILDLNPADHKLLWDTRAVDGFSNAIVQLENRIVFPSMYYLWYAKRTEFPLDQYLRDICLEHLID